MTPPLFIGLDGGATRSRAIAMDSLGRDVGRAQGPPAIVSVRTAAAAADTIARVVLDAARVAGSEPPVARLVAGLAGAGRGDAREAVRSVLEAMEVAREIVICSDSAIALDDAFEDGPGILVVAGTGSMALGRDADGREARAGGWGAALGDEGSGWWLGLHGLRAVTRAADGRGPATTLGTPLLEFLGLPDAEALIGWIETASKAEVAALAPVVLRAAADGDTVAGRLADRAAQELASAADAVRRALEPWAAPPVVAGVGGLVAGNGMLRDRVVAALADVSLSFDPREVIPARGAARRALRPA